MSDTRKDYIASLVFFFIGLGVLVSAMFIKDPGLSEMGPREFPRFIGICMVVLSVTLFGKTVYISRKQSGGGSERTASGAADTGEAGKNEWRALAIAVICLLYASAFTALGYFISTFAAITLICILFREKRIWVYPVLYFAAYVIWLGFTYLLAIRLP